MLCRVERYWAPAGHWMAPHELAASRRQHPLAVKARPSRIWVLLRALEHLRGVDQAALPRPFIIGLVDRLRGWRDRSGPGEKNSDVVLPSVAGFGARKCRSRTFFAGAIPFSAAGGGPQQVVGFTDTSVLLVMWCPVMPRQPCRNPLYR